MLKSFSQKIAVVTGGGSGLGKALALQLAQRGLSVYSIDKNAAALKRLQAIDPAIHIIKANVSTVGGRATIRQALLGLDIHYLIHNAAVVAPIVPLPAITLKAWRRLQATNLEAPLFLTQLLLPQLAPDARILHISSDCAHYALAHWIPYCTAKAALHMLYQCLRKELTAQNIHVGSVDPGMMDTPMQRYICQLQFPEKISLAELHQRQLIYTPERSAAFCKQVLLTTDDATFSAQEWQFRG